MKLISKLSKFMTRAKKNENLKKYAKLQTIFKGNNSTMRTHVSRMGMCHYNIYREKCIEGDIDMHTRCIPEEEEERLAGNPNGQYCIILTLGSWEFYDSIM